MDTILMRILKNLTTSLYFSILVFILAAGSAQAVEHSGLKMTDIKVGNGKEATLGARVKVHYTGWTMDGKKFDSSRDTNTPFKFSLGANEVIRGWDIGVQGMRVGGKRELIIPPDLAYGERGYPGAIPPNATLKFEVELLAVQGNSYSNVDNVELAKLLARGVPIIDLRRVDEWNDTGVIKNAHLITAFAKNNNFIPDFLKQLKATVNKQDEFIVICRSGRRSAYISRILADRKGYTHIYNVKDGILGWIKNGGEVVKP